MTSLITDHTDRTVWTEEDESGLVQFLINQANEGSQVANIKPSMWEAASAELSKLGVRGGAKMASSCKTKWSNVRTNHSLIICKVNTNDPLQLKKQYDAVEYLKNLSGFTFDDEKGIEVNDGNKDAWAAVVKVGFPKSHSKNIIHLPYPSFN